MFVNHQGSRFPEIYSMEIETLEVVEELFVLYRRKKINGWEVIWKCKHFKGVAKL